MKCKVLMVPTRNGLGKEFFGHEKVRSVVFMQFQGWVNKIFPLINA